MTIGVFDSGLGGLSVLRHLQRELPDESFLYVADSAHAPYGNKTEFYIQQRCLLIADFLFEQNVSAIVVACNTATAAAIAMIRERLEIPVIAIEPALKPASLATKTGRVGVLATASTLQSKQYKSLKQKFSDDVEYFEQAAHGLVELVEAGLVNDEKTNQLLEQYLQPMLKQGVDTIVLGCTHYPFLQPLIERIVGNAAVVIDTGAAIAEQLKKVLSEQQQSLCSPKNNQDRYFSSSDVSYSQQMIERLLQKRVDVEKLPV